MKRRAHWLGSSEIEPRSRLLLFLNGSVRYCCLSATIGSMPEHRGLELLTGTLLKICGDLVAATHREELGLLVKMKISHSDTFRSTLKDYVKNYNATNKTSLSVSFPKPFIVRLRAAERTAATARKSPTQLVLDRSKKSY